MLGEIIVVREEYVLLGEIGAQGIEFHPEHRIFRLAAEVAGAVEHRTKCLDTGLHPVGTAVKLPFLDYIIVEHLGGRHVRLLYDKTRILLRRAFGFLGIDVETLQHVGGVYLVLIR